MASYLPPVVTVFTGDIGDLLAKIAQAKAAMAALKATGGDIRMNVDTTGLAGATARVAAMNAAMNTGRRGVRLWGLGLMGWIKIIHNLFMVFGSQLIADTIGLVAFGAAAIHTLGPVFKNISNLGAAWNTFSGAQKVAATSLRNFIDGLQNHDIPVVTVFDTFLQLISSHMHSTGGVVDQAAMAFLNFAGDIKTAMASPAWQKFLGANTGVIQQDLSLLFATLTNLATALVSLAHNFNFMGVWALTGFGMVLKAITFLNEANPTLARFALLTLAAYHAITFLAKTRLATWAIGVTGGISGLTGAFTNMRMFGIGPTLALMAGLNTTAAVATATLVGGFAAVVVGLGILYVALSHSDAGIQATIQSFAMQDRAVGTNVQGYERLIATLHQYQDASVKALGGATGRQLQGVIQDTGQAIQAAADKVRILTYNFRFLEQQFGLTQTQAAQVAQRLGLVGEMTSRTFTAQDKANITAFINTMRQAADPLTALKFDMQQAANATLGLTDQLQGLTNAFNVLAAPFASTIQNTVTWKNDNITLANAVKAASGQVGFHTAAQRTAAAALATSITDTINLSQATLQSSHSYTAAAAVIRQEIGVLESLHSKSAIVARAIAILRAQLDSLHSKSITIGVNTVYTTTGGPNPIFKPGVGPPGAAPGPGVVFGPTGTAGAMGSSVIENHVHVHLNGKQIFSAMQKQSVRRQKNNSNNGLTRMIR